MKRGAQAGVLLAALLIAAPLAAEPWLARTGKETAAQVAAAFPDSAVALRRHLAALLSEGRHDEARAVLARLAAMGFALSPAGEDQVGPMLDAPLRARFQANATVVGAPDQIGQVPARFGLVESAVRLGDLTVASGVTMQDLFVSHDGQAWRALGLQGLGSLGGLVADRRRGLVWASSGRFEQTPRPVGAFFGLVLVDPRKARIVRRVAAPKGVVPGDIALGGKGALYVSDPINGGVWKARAGARALVQLVPAGTFRSPQGLAPSADGRRLYVSDYGTGIAVVDLPTGQVRRLSADAPMMLDGIDGLYRHADELVGLQNGTRPMRIVAIRLSEDGLRATSLRVLHARLPGDGEPTSGEVKAGRLHYVGNARWDLYGKGGVVTEGGNVAATMLYSLPLSPAM